MRKLKLFGLALTVSSLMATTAMAETVLRLGHVWSNSEVHAVSVQKFADDVSAATNGEVRIDIYGNSTLGSDRELLEGIKFMTNDIWVGGAGVLSTASDTARIFTIPFMIQDIDHYNAVYDGEVGQQVTDAIRNESGYEVLSYWLRGPRWLTTKKEIHKPDDLSGLKVRVPDSTVTVKSWNQLGVAATPMNFGEVFNALQQGVIDGQENPLSLIDSSQFAQVVKYLIRTEHAYEPVTVVMDAQRLQEMPENHRKAIMEAANGVAKKYAADEVNKGEQAFLTKLQNDGMILIEPDKQPFQEKVGSDFVKENFPTVSDLYTTIVGVGTPANK
ncbi:TRAP transporter substrate-binding protein [Paenochrobactrum sp. BZR 201-1]